jgi:hypothetical protein
VGYSRRKEARELVEVIEESNARIQGVTLGQLCASGTVVLTVACHRCPRRGRYRLTRLIDRYGSTMLLPKLAEVLSADCPSRRGTGYFTQCGVHFPNVKPHADISAGQQPRLK